MIPNAGLPKEIQSPEAESQEMLAMVICITQPPLASLLRTLGTGPAGKSRLKLYGQNLQAMNHYPLRFCPFSGITLGVHPFNSLDPQALSLMASEA